MLKARDDAGDLSDEIKKRSKKNVRSTSSLLAVKFDTIYEYIEHGKNNHMGRCIELSESFIIPGT